VAAATARLEASEPALNAFITACLDRAEEEGRAAERAVVAGAPLGPLHGVPFSAKDLLNTAGVRTTFGSFAFEGNVPAADCVAVARLRMAGAILIGKTTTPEFGHKPLTEAPLFGRTANPWDPGRTCGGSSGGGAASVAASVTPFGLGTDGGGSTRIPAAACGVVGMKQTLGVVPHDQTPDAFGLLAYIGPLARTVADAGLVLEVISGPHPSDPNSLGRTVSGLTEAAAAGRSLRGLRLGYLPLLGNEVIERETRVLVDAAVHKMADAGAEIEPLEEALPPTYAIWGPLTFSIWAQRFGPHEQALGERMSESLRRWMAEGRRVGALDVQAAMEGRTRLFRHVQGWFERFDFLLTPTLACPAVAIDHAPAGELVIEGVKTPSLREGWYPYTHPFNLTGHPALTVPAGWTSPAPERPALPVGLQIVGPYFSDADVVAIGRAYERLAPWRERYRAIDLAHR